MPASRTQAWEQAIAAGALVLGLGVTMAFLTFGSLTATVTATALAWVLVLTALGLAVDVCYRYGIQSWTLLATALLTVGALAQAVVTFIGVPGIAATLPAPFWGLGFLVVLRGVRNQ